MAIEFVAASNESVYGAIAPATALPLAVTVPFKMAANPAASQTLAYFGDSASGTNYLIISVNTDGTVTGNARGLNSSLTATTANSIDTTGVNVVTVIVEENQSGASERIRVKLNGGTPASALVSSTPSAMATWNRVAFGRSMDSTPTSPADAQIEQPCLWLSNDDFADHDAIWNAGTPLNPASLSLGEDHRWPFSDETGNVAGTDAAIDDAVGALDLDTVGGSPTYVANFLTTQTPGTLTVDGGADDDFVSTGPEGGPFVPASQVFTVENTGDVAIDVATSVSEAWAETDTPTVNLDPDETADVTIALNAGADALAIGAHAATITFTNSTNGAGNTTRDIDLTVTENAINMLLLGVG